MQKIWTIAAREYKAAVCTKAFLISLALMPLMMGGSFIAQIFLEGMKDLKAKRYVVVDRTPESKLAKILASEVAERNATLTKDMETGERVEPDFEVEIVPPSPGDPESILRQRYELSERVRRKEISGFLEIGKNVLKEPISKSFAKRLQGALSGKSGAAAAVDKLKSQLSFGLLESSSSKANDAKSNDAASVTGTDKLDAEKADAPGGRPSRRKLALIIEKLPDGNLIRYQTNNQMNNEFSQWANVKLNDAICRVRSEAAKLPADRVEAISRQTYLASKDLAKLDSSSGKIIDGKSSDFLVSFMIPFGIVMLMFMVVMIGASPLLNGVIEEKIQRIAEVLLGSVTPFQLMAGKLIGVVGVSLTLSTVYLGGAYWAAHRFGYTEYVPVSLIWWFLLFQTLSVLMFGAAFIAVGAACSDIKEAQTMMTPVTLVLVFPMMILGNVIKEPESKLSQVMSFFPPATPMLMTVRQSVPPGIPFWQPILGVVVTLATTVFLVWAAGRIFRIGLLMQGKAPSFRELIQWVARG